MPYRCCVPLCKGNYASGPKVAVYSFPKDNKMKSIWLSAIQRKDFNPTKSSKVCKLHFKEEDFITESSAFDNQTGRLIVVPLLVKRLKSDAVPSIFNLFPKSVLKDNVPRREDSEINTLKKKNNQIEKPFAISIKEENDYFEEIAITSLDDILRTYNSDNFWNALKNDKNEVCLFHLAYDPCPTVEFSLIISSELYVLAYYKDKKLSQIHSYNFPHKLSNFTELSDILNNLKNCDQSNEKSNCLEIISNLLSNLRTEENESVVMFIEEQIKLLMSNKNKYHYSNEYLIFSILLHTISPQCYRFIRSSATFVLPHESTITKICHNLSVSPENGWESNHFLSHAKIMFQNLKPHEHTVILLCDKINLKSCFNYEDGSELGSAFNSNDPAKSVFTFMLSSVLSSFKEVIYVMAVNSIEFDVLHTIFQNVIVGLEEIGFKVICVITDNNSINRKAMSLFSPNNDVSFVHPHPFDDCRPLFHLIDPVLLFKCIRNNWVNQKNAGKCFSYPDFEGSNSWKTARFETLKNLYDIYNKYFVTFANGLTLSCLGPSKLDRQNVELVLKVFNKFVVDALNMLGTKCNLMHSKDTADFLSIISKWWDVMNVKSNEEGHHQQNPFMTPLTADTLDPKNKFIEKFLSWLEVWKNKKYSEGSLSKKTHEALCMTTHGMIQLGEYCVNELGFNYILPGKFQTDCWKSRFGKYRQLAGARYNIPVSQLVECEKKLRLQSIEKFDIPTLSSNFVMQNVETMPEIDDFNYNNLVDVNDNDLENTEKYLPILTYLAGYCCHSVLNKSNCIECKDFLVNGPEINLPENTYVLIKNLNKGGLLYPSYIVTNSIVYNFIVISKTMQEQKFMTLDQRTTVTATMSILDIHEKLFDNNETCAKNHNLNSVLRNILWVSTNIFLKNFCLKNNDKNVKKNSIKNTGISKKRKLNTLK